MEAVFKRLILVFFACCLTSGCGLNTAVLQKGASNCKGVLLNLSCGARPCDPIDSSKPTIVITHGWNPLPNHLTATLGCSGAKALRRRCGDSYNILSWDWNAVKVPALGDGPIRTGKCQGRMLAAALRQRGVQPHSTQIIAHSLGNVVAAQAAKCLRDLGPMRQITMLDPPTQHHDELFCCLQVTRHACVVENYWSPGISGFGEEVCVRGVRNYEVKGYTPVRGAVDLSMSNHQSVMLWYYHTMCCPSMRCGFQNSCFINYCGCSEPCYCGEDKPEAQLAVQPKATEAPEAPDHDTQLR